MNLPGIVNLELPWTRYMALTRTSTSLRNHMLALFTRIYLVPALPHYAS